MSEGRKTKIKWRRIATVYFFSAIIVIIASFFALILSLPLPEVPVDVSSKVLENVIRLNGVLFGFTAAMLSIVYYKEKSYDEKFYATTVFSVTSFLSFLLSIFIAFCFLINQTQSSQIFVPVILTCFGGLCSSVYIVLTVIGIEKEE